MPVPRVIARLDVKGPNVVKSIHLEGPRVLGDPRAFVRRDDEHGTRNNILDVVRRTGEDVFVPLTVGGGPRSIDDVRDAPRSGTDKVTIEANTERTEGTSSKSNSVDDGMDGLYDFITWIKFRRGRASYDAAQEIRNHHLTREEGVALVRRLDGEVPRKWLRESLDYTGIIEARFWELIDQFRSPHLWRREGDTWVLQHQAS